MKITCLPLIFLHRHLLSMVVLLLIHLLFYSSAGQAQTATFTNPVRNGADPWVFQMGREYYYCATMDDGIAISKSTSLTDHGTFQQVWRSTGNGWNAANIWATELHFIDGHCSFARSQNGKEDWILYHSKKTTKPGWERDIRLQRFGWNKDGNPDFGTPVPEGKPLAVPSGK